jgi:nucleotide-binding universal stress UspA family protein
MKILVPTDFSAHSGAAVDFAVELARKANASIHLLNNATYDAPPTAGVFVNMTEKVAQQAREDLSAYAKKVREQAGNDIDVSWEVTSYPKHSNSINKVSDSSGASLIIMGSKGKSGIEGAFMGHVAYQSLTGAVCPVIVIPPDCKFREEGNTLFAVDVKNIPSEESIRALGVVLNLINHSLDLLFVNVKGDEEEIFRLRDHIQKMCSSTDVQVYTESKDDIPEAIGSFIEDHHSSMLVVHPGHHGIIDNLLGKSITKKLLAQSHVPVLSIP